MSENLKKNKVRRGYIVVMVSFLLNLIGCSQKERVVVIGDIAYDAMSEETCVYINENGVYVPFVVLSSQYTEGNSLLLRKEILADMHRVNDYSSYYENSEIDVFLNTEYYSQLDDIASYISCTDISIIDDGAIGRSGSDIKIIERNVFLLSLSEVGIDTSVNSGAEGKALSYFSVLQNRICYKDEETVGWILRTPDTYFLSTVYEVGVDGEISFINAYDESGIRPAFCVKSQTPILKREGIVYGEEVYVLD